MKKLLLLTACLLMPLTSNATDLEYKGFYKRLNLIKENKLDEITMGFYLVDTHSRDRCKLDNATLLAQGDSPTNIDIGDDGQLKVGLNKDWYDKFAFLRVKQHDEYQSCTLQMQMQVKDKTKTSFTYQELAIATDQMQDLVDDFGSFLWFMMPNVKGLHINLKDTTKITYIEPSLGKGLTCDILVCKLVIDDAVVDSNLENDNEATPPALVFNEAPVVIAPWIEK